MNKEIFKRILPIIVGSFFGAAIVALVLCALEWTSVARALMFVFAVLIVTAGVQFFFARKEVLDEMLEEHSVNTPLPIVYINEKGKKKLYDVPYLDLEKIDKVWGFALGDVFVALKNYSSSEGEKFRFKDIKRALRRQLLTGERFSSISRLPTSVELFHIRANYKKIKATIMLLKFYDVAAENWKEDRYICVDDITDYNSDEFYENGEVEKQAFTINMAEDKNPNKMELPDSVSAYVRLVAK